MENSTEKIPGKFVLDPGKTLPKIPKNFRGDPTKNPGGIPGWWATFFGWAPWKLSVGKIPDENPGFTKNSAGPWPRKKRKSQWSIFWSSVVGIINPEKSRIKIPDWPKIPRDLDQKIKRFKRNELFFGRVPLELLVGQNPGLLLAKSLWAKSRIALGKIPESLVGGGPAKINENPG